MDSVKGNHKDDKVKIEEKPALLPPAAFTHPTDSCSNVRLRELEQQAKEANTVISSMEAQLHEMKDERTALKNSYAQDRAVLVAAHAAEMSRLQQDAVAGKTYRGQLEASLVDKSKYISELQERVRELGRTLNATHQDHKNVVSTLSTKHRHELQAVETSSRRFEEELNTKLTKAMTELEVQRMLKSQTIDKMALQKHEHASQIATFQKRLRTLEELYMKLDAPGHSWGEAQEYVTLAERFEAERAAASRFHAQEYATIRKDLDMDRHKLQAQAREYSKLMQSFEPEHTTLKKKVIEYEAMYKKAAASLVEHEAALMECKGKLDDCQETLVKADKQYGTISVRCSAAEDARDVAVARIVRLETEVKNLDDEAKDLCQQLGNRGKELAALKRGSQAEISSLESQLALVREEAWSRLDKRARELAKLRRDSREEIANLKAQLVAANGQDTPSSAEKRGSDCAQLKGDSQAEIARLNFELATAAARAQLMTAEIAALKHARQVDDEQDTGPSPKRPRPSRDRY